MEQDSQSGAPLVEVIDASITGSRTRRSVASHVDWRVASEEFWLIGGRQGSGKTAFLSTIAGLQRPRAGLIRLFGEDLSHLPEPELLKQRTRIGFVFKGGGRMFAGLTVAENVALPLRYHWQWNDEKAGERVHAILEATELTDEADSTAQILGWGRQQRVGLARALALNPELLFLDEPLSGLEARDRRWWRSFLDTLSQGAPLTEGRKVTMIATTNDFGSWSGGSHHRGLLQEGRWQQYGEGKESPDIV
jgi:ABC-type transporter Mla maintaining outer membrane lipid asymmetry ATPase subunit MlaF